MVLDVANQLKTAVRASMASEPFPHFHGVGTTQCIHGIGIFYGTQQSQPAWHNPLHFHGIGNGTRCSQPAKYNLPHFHSVGTSPHFHDIGIFYGSCCSQPALYNPPGFLGAGSFMVLDATTSLVQPFALPRRRNLYGTR